MPLNVVIRLISTISLLGIVTPAIAVPTITKVSITGNSSIPEDALLHNLRRLGIISGHALEQKQLDTMVERVREHYHYFRRTNADIEMRLQPVTKDSVEVELHIHEKSTDAPQTAPAAFDEDTMTNDASQNDGILSLGVGYGNKGALGKLSLTKHNIFDSDFSIRLSGIHDRYESNAELAISKASLFDSPLRLEAKIFYDRFNYTRSRIASPYRRQSYGGELMLRYPIDHQQHSYIGLRYTHNRLKDIQAEFHRAHYLSTLQQTQWKIHTQDIDVLLGWRFTQFDQRNFPTKGLGLSLDGQISAPFSDNRYYRVRLSGKAYYPLSENKQWIIAAKTTFAYARGMSGHRIPFYQNYTAGGQDTLRGFAYNSIGPIAYYPHQALQKVSTQAAQYRPYPTHIIGGNALAAASLELIVPSFYVPKNYQSQVRTSFFIDAASVWETQFKHPQARLNGHAHRIRSSAGVSIQWNFGIGVLSVSYAVPLKKYPYDKKEPFQINLSSHF